MCWKKGWLLLKAVWQLWRWLPARRQSPTPSRRWHRMAAILSLKKGGLRWNLQPVGAYATPLRNQHYLCGCPQFGEITGAISPTPGNLSGSPGQSQQRHSDIDAIAEIAHAHNLPLVIDNTFGTHTLSVNRTRRGCCGGTATKFIGGHGTTLGGIIVDSGKFDWKSSGNYPAIADPNPSYHGVSFGRRWSSRFFCHLYPGDLATGLRQQPSPHLTLFFCCKGWRPFPSAGPPCGKHQKSSGIPGKPSSGGTGEPSFFARPSNHALYQNISPTAAVPSLRLKIKGGQQEAHQFIDHLEIFSLLANVADVKAW